MSKKVKIYVADHDADVVRFIRGTLAPAGHTVQEALDLDNLVDELQVFAPDLVFVTATSTDHDLVAMVREIRGDEEIGATPLVALADRKDSDIDGLRRIDGLNDVMSKPLMANELLARVKHHTGERHDGTTEVNLSSTASAQLFERAVLPISDLQTGSQRYDRDLATFIEVTEAVSSSLEPDDAFYVLVKRAADAITCDRCNVVLRGVDEAEAFVVASHDNPNLRRHAINLERYPEYLLAMESLEPVLIDDAQVHPVTEKVRSNVTKVNLSSTLVFPLVVRETAVGVMSMSTRGSSRQFEPAEVLLVRALANLAACAVKSTTALERIRYHAVSQKAPVEEFENIVLDLDDQIEMLIDEFEGG
jgi:CheY-like chemotaxis protein